MPDDFRRFRKQDVARRPAQTFSRAFGDYEQGRSLPIAGERETGDNHQIQKVADGSNRPIGACAIREASRKISQARRDHLAQSRDDADLRRARAQVFEQRPNDAVRAFVGHVSEQADKAQRDNESKCAFSILT